MITSILILYTCLLIALVVTIPTQQEVLLKGNPALFWDQANNINAKIPIDVRISKIQSAVPTISLPNPAGLLHKENQPNSVIDQLLYNSVINNPGLLNILRGFQSSNYALQNEMQNSERIPNIINNYIILPPDVLDSSGSQVKCAFNDPNSCIRVKKNASKRPKDVPKTSNQPTISDTLHLSEFSKKVVRNKQNLNKNQQRTHVPKREETVSADVNNHSNKKDLMKNALKKSLHEKNKSKLHNHLFKTKEFQPKQHSLNETWSNEDINTNIRNEIEDTKIAQQQEENGKSLLDLQSPLNVLNKTNVTNNNRKHKNSLKKSNTTNSKSQIVLQNKKQQEANELPHKKHSKQDKRTMISCSYMRKKMFLENIMETNITTENDGNEDKRVSNKASKEEGEVIQRSIQFQSPRLLDNPGFRTRKVDEINEKYEPYYYHNVFQNTNDDFNKYYLDDTTEICSTSIIPKNNLKSCNKSNHSSTGIKSMRKDANVETVYAPAKLAKYGLAL
ncbi:unnamed protein product [Parnassius apollo]|uniref:(apollo) hypothetical protein n=1 Tax=Parnassius apollo TaxID=110799 RepID=A0A8S3WFZ1_PARAO|nr:unnamed protein product [Parnassius apollo]